MKTYRNEDGEWHRVNGPAVEWENGAYDWCDNGAWHRYYGVARHWYGDFQYWIFGKEIK